MERCSNLLITDPKIYHGKWLETFGYMQLRVELGCGKGRFTVEAAKAEPDTLFVALEKSDSVIIIALERVAAEGLKNVRFINALANDVTDFFAPGEVSRIYINFCDPWPSNRHAKRRLTSWRFLELYKKILQPGGQLHFKTDNLSLFEFSLLEFERCGFELSEVIRDLHAKGIACAMTDYELKFHSQGLPIYKCLTKRSMLK